MHLVAALLVLLHTSGAALAWAHQPSGRDPLGLIESLPRNARSGRRLHVSIFDDDKDFEANFNKGRAKLARKVERMRSILQTHGPRIQTGGGRGIVIPAGGRQQLGNAYVSVSVLRGRLGCRLPIEIVHNGEAELPTEMRRLFEAFEDVTFRDGSLAEAPHHKRIRLDGFLFKAFALYGTTFDQVLMLDSDNLPLENPTALFEIPAFAEHGNLFWPDFWKDHLIKREAYAVLGLEAPWDADEEHRTTESGQLLLDRARYADVVEWIWFLNSHHEIMYRYAYGDKDLYRLAFILAGKLADFQQLPFVPRIAMGAYDRDGNADEVLGLDSELAARRKAVMHVEDHRGPLYLVLGQVHHGAEGAPAFFHRVTPGAKFNPDSGLFTEVGLISEPLSVKQAYVMHIGSDVVAGVNAFQYWLQPTQIEIQHRGSTRCKVHADSVHKCQKADRGWPIRTAHISRYPAALRQTLDASYSAFADFQRATDGRIRPLTHAGQVIY